MAALILNAHEENFNIWEIDVEMKDDGGIYYWDPKSRAKVPFSTLKFNRLMCNYMSIGLESRVGLGFEKKRQNSALGNKCCYAWEGIKKMCCLTRTKKVKDVILNVSTKD